MLEPGWPQNISGQDDTLVAANHTAMLRTTTQETNNTMNGRAAAWTTVRQNSLGPR